MLQQYKVVQNVLKWSSNDLCTQTGSSFGPLWVKSATVWVRLSRASLRKALNILFPMCLGDTVHQCVSA